ncbi:MAG: polyprenyl synthetase family protein [Clostridia bacterium]|nr:polyprenyl synthetase family protein [Clostridia bacterium]
MRTMNDYVAQIEARLNELLPQSSKNQGVPVLGEMPELLQSSMRYSLLAGGKRLRPAMMLACAEMFLGDIEHMLDVACAVEMIHTYSLIHDDLPAMDNDSLRRGRPTNHVVFGEAQALLAGDGLLNYAFECMLNAALRYPEKSIAFVRALGEVAQGAGVTGMIAGQTLDVQVERNGASGEELLQYIQINKTARMFIHPLRASAILSGANENDIESIGRFGRAFGLLFQATDDLLDVLGDGAKVGKTLGKDAAGNKLTCISQFGIDGTRKRVHRFAQEAQNALNDIHLDTSFFESLLRDMMERDH